MPLIIVVCGLFTLAIGVATLLGFHPTNIFPQFDINQPHFAYDSSIGFFIAGVGLLAAFFKQRILTLITGILLLLIALATLINSYDPNWNLTEFLMGDYIPLNQSFSKPMEFMAALLFIVVGTLFSVLAFKVLKTKIIIIITGILGVFLTLVGLLHVFGYFLIPYTNDSSHNLLGPLGSNSAIAFTVIGSGIIFLSIYSAQKTQEDFKKIAAIIISIAIAILSLIFWRITITHQHFAHLSTGIALKNIIKEIGLASLLGVAVYFIQKNWLNLRRIKHSYALTKATLEASAEGIIVIDNNGKIIEYNQKFLDMWNIPKKTLQTKEAHLFLNYLYSKIKNKRTTEAAISKMLKHTKTMINIEIKLKNNCIYDMHTFSQPTKDKTIARVFSFHDITHIKRTENEVRYNATHDILTGLTNRVVLLQQIEENIQKSYENNTKLAVLFFDLNRFKLINDSLGHSIGDSLLQSVAQRLRKATRSQDILARLGGDEFVALINELHDEASIQRIVDRYLHVFADPFHLEQHDLIVGCSIGISFYPKDGETAETLLENADLAMYKAKSSRLKHQWYSAEMHQEIIANLTLENELNHALQRDQFLLFYQPVVDLRSRKINSIEALIRWNHPTLGFKTPNDFVPIAERIGLMPAIGEWIIRNACMQFKKWQEQGVDVGERVCVNIAESQLKQPLFHAKVFEILSEINFDAQQLIIELHENILVEPLHDIQKTIEEIYKMGAHISIDDFGIGHSSLTLLKQLPVNKLKIDKSYVFDLAGNDAAKAMVRAIISIGKDLKLEVLAEGVENTDQLVLLQNYGCEYIQGYYFSKPLEVEAYEKHIPTLHNLLKSNILSN